MGTTLTGTTPQDTYDSLIKVTDNGPLSGTAKYLSDGLGNDSALALSTGNIGIGTTSPSQPLVVFKANAADDIGQIIQQGANGTAAFLNIVGNNDAGASFNRITSSTSGGTAHWQIGGGGAASTMVLLTGGSERMRITSEGNVAIGTSSPASFSDGFVSLQVKNAANNISANGGSYLEITQNANFDSGWKYVGSAAASRYEQGVGGHYFFTAPSGTAGNAVTFTERVRIDSDGLKFNGDTAAANALDDYEEGTWTPAFSFSGAAVGLTYSFSEGKYTKIGNKVTLNCFTSVSNKGTSTGALRIGGFPFTIANNTADYCPAALRPNGVSFADQMIAYGEGGLTYINVQEISLAGSVTDLTDADCNTSFSFMMQITYFV
jgi:hypothetical protein